MKCNIQRNIIVNFLKSISGNDFHSSHKHLKSLVEKKMEKKIKRSLKAKKVCKDKEKDKKKTK